MDDLRTKHGVCSWDWRACVHVVCVFVCVLYCELERECAVIPGIGTVCDSEIMVLSRVSVRVCLWVTTAISHRHVCVWVWKRESKSYLQGTTVILFNQYSSTHTHTLLCTLSTYGSCLPSLSRLAAAFGVAGVGMKYHREGKRRCRNLWKNQEKDEGKTSKAYDVQSNVQLSKAWDCRLFVSYLQTFHYF